MKCVAQPLSEGEEGRPGQSEQNFLRLTSRLPLLTGLYNILVRFFALFLGVAVGGSVNIRTSCELI